MSNYYVEDYEQVTGNKPEPDDAIVETKVITAPETPDAESSDVKAETK